ncbi:DNA cytosine methyltransferase [[Clostridium] aminophilum]|uniref:DNA (cytosine-5-)-methyltransferase n=1 Tax=[Clostridium] aminophilum TaxID=1526 RepID=A0A1I6JJZ2_9FIRM|nr:DNA cytosine methyltransferase [[Clostridium] aminophilum]SFR78940.1 DNA (cytosine-5)-methyltransferase 1 [[Clostridium] aminophilum]
MIDSIELFCGAGGLALGLQKAGLNHKALFEWDKCSCDNIDANISRGFNLVSDWNVFNIDVRSVDYKSYRGNIDVVSGGPPCQPFSLGGKAKANNDARDMWPEAIRAVREILPKAFIFENVKGLLRPAFSDYFNYILLQLQYPTIVRESEEWSEHYLKLKNLDDTNIPEGETYSIQYRLVNVADYGVPQSRFRVIIVGFRKNLHTSYAFPEPLCSKDALLYDKWVSGTYWKEHGLEQPQCGITQQKLNRLRSNPPKLKRWRTVRDAIADLPSPENYNGKEYTNHEYRAGAKSYAGHSGSVLDEPSKTIKAGVHGVPGGENMVVLDDGSIRYYTVRESARIQTFDDEYIFAGPWGEAMRQIGNAVPVKLAEIVGNSVVEELERL